MLHLPAARAAARRHHQSFLPLNRLEAKSSAVADGGVAAQTQGDDGKQYVVRAADTVQQATADKYQPARVGQAADSPADADSTSRHRLTRPALT